MRVARSRWFVVAVVALTAAASVLASSGNVVRLQFVYRPGANFAKAPDLGNLSARSLYVAPLGADLSWQGSTVVGAEGMGADRQPVWTEDSLQAYALGAARTTMERWGARVSNSEQAANYVLRVGLVRAYVSERSNELKGQVVLRLALEDTDRRTLWSGQVVGVGFADDPAQREQRFNEALGAAVVDALAGFVAMPALNPQVQHDAQAAAPAPAGDTAAAPPEPAATVAEAPGQPAAAPDALASAPAAAATTPEGLASAPQSATATTPEPLAGNSTPATTSSDGSGAAAVLGVAAIAGSAAAPPPVSSQAQPEMSAFEQPPINEIKPAAATPPAATPSSAAPVVAAAAVGATVAAASAPKPAPVVTTGALLDELTRLKKAGMSDETLLAYLKQRDVKHSELSADELVAFYQAGFSDAIVKAVLDKK